MKSILNTLILVILFTSSLFAQNPEWINYTWIIHATFMVMQQFAQNAWRTSGGGIIPRYNEEIGMEPIKRDHENWLENWYTVRATVDFKKTDTLSIDKLPLTSVY